MANKFVLAHRELRVEYTLGITPGAPALIYSDGRSAPERFTETQITTDTTALGTLVSVPLRDPGGKTTERFGFLLPVANVSSGQAEDFRSVGVYEHVGPDSRPEPSWRAVELHGTAETVIVPL